jgi:hypothetical protein
MTRMHGFILMLLFAGCENPCTKTSTKNALGVPDANATETGAMVDASSKQDDDEDDDVIPDAGTLCKPSVEVSFGEGIPQFAITGFPCVSANQETLAYALSDGEQSIVLVNLKSGSVSKRLPLITKAEIEYALETEELPPKARFAARAAETTRALKEVIGDWHYASFSHGRDELEDIPLQAGPYIIALAHEGIVTVKTQTGELLYKQRLSEWHRGQHASSALALQDIATVPEANTIVLRSNVDNGPSTLRILRWPADAGAATKP